MEEKKEDLRKLTRTVLRQNDVNIIMNSQDGDVMANNVKVSPKFASIVEEITAASNARKEEIFAMLPDMVTVWTPDMIDDDVQKDVQKKKPAKAKKTKKATSSGKKKNKHDIIFTTDKKMPVCVVFDADF